MWFHGVMRRCVDIRFGVLHIVDASGTERFFEDQNVLGRGRWTLNLDCWCADRCQSSLTYALGCHKDLSVEFIVSVALLKSTIASLLTQVIND